MKTKVQLQTKKIEVLSLDEKAECLKEEDGELKKVIDVYADYLWVYMSNTRKEFKEMEEEIASLKATREKENKIGRGVQLKLRGEFEAECKKTEELLGMLKVETYAWKP